MKRKLFILAIVVITVLLITSIVSAQPPRTLAKSASSVVIMQGTAAVDDSNPCASGSIVATASPTQAAAIATASAPMSTEEAPIEVARPSNAGGPGPAMKLVGNVGFGTQVFIDYCWACHGDRGVGGIANPGSSDGTIPSLNPIDDTLVDKDAKVFACNIDLFVEHGSTPGGDNPKEVMPAWGDEAKLNPQQIADVIAYVISLNKDQPSGTEAATATK